jgi:hypothetical protein
MGSQSQSYDSLESEIEAGIHRTDTGTKSPADEIFEFPLIHRGIRLIFGIKKKNL